MKQVKGALIVAVMVLTTLALEAAPASAALNHDAAITGKVSSNSGAKLSGLTVQAKSSTGKLYTTHSDSKGRFYLSGLPKGKYGLKFSDRVGLNPCPEKTCSDEFNPYLKTEWLGDAATYSASTKIRLSQGEKHTGVRVLVDHYARLTGHVQINGRPATYDDGITIERLAANGKVQSSQAANSSFFEDIETRGNYRLRVSSSTGSFAPFYVTDPRDGNSVFHIAGVEKITAIPIVVTSP